MYDGNYYVLPLQNIELSTQDVESQLEPYSVITTGYVTFESESSYDYNFGKNLVKAVYHDKDTVYLVVPVSYMQDWVSKRLLNVIDNHYVLNNDLIVSGGIQSKHEEVVAVPEIIDLPVPSRGEIPSVIIR